MYAEATKRCGGPCGMDHPLSAFNNNKAKKDGKQNWCKVCHAQAMRESRVRNRASFLYRQTKGNAAKRGIPFLLTLGWFQEKVSAGKCELTGIDFVLDQKRHAYLPSPDRIDTNGTYCPENCRLVLWIINAAKGVTPDGEFQSAFLQVAEALSEQG